MDPTTPHYQLAVNHDSHFDGITNGFEYNPTPFVPREGFPVSPATSYEAALLSVPNAQPSPYGAYAPNSHAMEYVQNMYHMQFAQEMSQNFNDNLPNLPYGARTMITSDGKRKRRRIITHEQRKAANVRERRRMYHLNEAFDDLRKRVPTFAYEKKLSRIETLKLAVTYIQFMSETLEDMDSVIENNDTNASPKSSDTESSSREDGEKIKDMEKSKRLPLGDNSSTQKLIEQSKRISQLLCNISEDTENQVIDQHSSVEL